MADAGVGEAAAAEGGKTAAEAGAGDAALAGGAADVAADAGVVGATAGSGAGAGLALDAGADTALAGGAADALAGGAASGTAMGGAAGTLGAADSALASQALGYSAADVGGDAAIAGGAGDTAMGGAAGTLGAADSSAASTALGYSAADVAPALTGADLAAGGFGDVGAGGAGASFLPVTGADAPGGMGALGGFGDFLGIGGDAGLGANTGFEAGEFAGGGLDTGIGVDAGATGGDFSGWGANQGFEGSEYGAGSSGSSGVLGQAGDWLGGHKALAGLLGMDALNALRRPALPSAGKTAQGASTAEVNQALGIIQSGGTSSPQWAVDKASIDASINQQMQAAQAQLEQTAATNGMGGKNSMVVQQQLQKMGSDMEAKRQELYAQALQQITTQAVTMLSGGNQTLGGIAQMQLQQDSEAQSAVSNMAEMALLLGG